MRPLSLDELGAVSGGEAELRHGEITVTGRQPPVYSPNGGHFPIPSDPCADVYQSEAEANSACSGY